MSGDQFDLDAVEARQHHPAGSGLAARLRRRRIAHRGARKP
jgi:hypothetical protein